MGYPIVRANGLMMSAHYLNTGSQPITPTVSITIYPAKPGWWPSDRSALEPMKSR
jgi:hypothetical protein